jgi:hypothetical protein
MTPAELEMGGIHSANEYLANGASKREHAGAMASRKIPAITATPPNL